MNSGRDAVDFHALAAQKDALWYELFWHRSESSASGDRRGRLEPGQPRPSTNTTSRRTTRQHGVVVRQRHPRGRPKVPARVETAVRGRPTLDDIKRTWPATVSVEEACAALGISRSYGYELAGRNEFPCRVLTVGTRRRVITAQLVSLLGDEDRPVVARRGRQ